MEEVDGSLTNSNILSDRTSQDMNKYKNNGEYEESILVVCSFI